MEKFLFTDGNGGFREVFSREELEALVSASSNPDKIRVWQYDSNEWISWTAFAKIATHLPKLQPAIAGNQEIKSSRSYAGKQWLKKFLFLAGFLACAFLVINFTRVKWEKEESLNISAARPDNMHPFDIDSLIGAIEAQRDQKLDRSTRTNLRLRNTWPERILLQLSSEKETSKNDGERYSNLHISIDNTTGFPIDNAIVKLTVWKKDKVNSTDTIRFNNISYSKLAKRELNGIYRGDSISLSFESIRAKSFNFCYSSSIKNGEDHYDKWFCKD